MFTITITFLTVTIFLFQNSEALLEDRKVDSVSTRAMNDFSNELEKILISNTVACDDPELCEFLICKEPGQKWIVCESCEKWLHYACVGIKRVPRGQYTCVVCKALWSDRFLCLSKLLSVAECYISLQCRVAFFVFELFIVSFTKWQH